MSGYVNCACRDCFEIAIGDDDDFVTNDDDKTLCWECAEAGCDATGASECCCAACEGRQESDYA
jgi:hypothetical protein